MTAVYAVRNHSHFPLRGTGIYLSASKWLFTCLYKPKSPATKFRYQSRPNLIIVPPTVLDNWHNKFVKTFDPKAKNPIELMIRYSAAPSVIRPSCPENLMKLQ